MKNKLVTLKSSYIIVHIPLLENIKCQKQTFPVYAEPSRDPECSVCNIISSIRTTVLVCGCSLPGTDSSVWAPSVLTMWSPLFWPKLWLFLGKEVRTLLISAVLKFFICNYNEEIYLEIKMKAKWFFFFKKIELIELHIFLCCPLLFCSLIISFKELHKNQLIYF